MRLKILILPLLLTVLFADARRMPTEMEKSNKGRIYGFWGWNRGWYSNSDIHFTGSNYDFKLNDVEAKDRQTPFDFGTYFGLSTISIPQTNFRLGYFVSNNIDISFGVDHMKYVMVSAQETEISGKIQDGTVYDGYYSNDAFEINKPFLEYEHTDGLNYLNFEITRNDDLAKTLKFNLNPNKIQINTLLGFGIGAMMPKSNVTLWNNERNDDFHFAGYGFSGKVGLNATFFKHFFLRSEYKLGFIDMPDVRTSPDPIDRASQHFFFRQLNFSFGFTFNPFN
jgi:hypothetical protein